MDVVLIHAFFRCGGAALDVPPCGLIDPLGEGKPCASMAHGSGNGVEKLVVKGVFQAVSGDTVLQKHRGNFDGKSAVRMHAAVAPASLQPGIGEEFAVFCIGDMQKIEGLTAFVEICL